MNTNFMLLAAICQFVQLVDANTRTRLHGCYAFKDECHFGCRPELPPPPFVPPFDPPGSQSPYIPGGSSTDDDSDEGDGSTTASSNEDLGPRPDWWPEDWTWPPEPEEPVVLEAYPPIHTWPRLPPDHPYHVPPGYSATDSLPPGHPGEYQAARELRRLGRGITIIALTANAMKEDRDHCLAIGCTKYTSTPLDSRTVLTIMQRLAQSRRP